MKVPLLDLKPQYETLKDEIQKAIAELSATQMFILGPHVVEFEEKAAKYCQSGYGCAVSSGSDALLIALMVENIGAGDEVITTPYSFVATTHSIWWNGLTPVFVDVDPATGNLDPQKIEEAMGGVLFIEEAYALAKEGNDFGQEAIDTILKAMEDNRKDFIVIVAGYTKPMETFIESNPGLKSRFNKYIEFADYTMEELTAIFQTFCDKYEYEIDEENLERVTELLRIKKTETFENFANAREVRNLFEKIITNQARRISAMENPSVEDMRKILYEDLFDEEEQ